MRVIVNCDMCGTPGTRRKRSPRSGGVVCPSCRRQLRNAAARARYLAKKLDARSRIEGIKEAYGAES